MHSFFRWAVGAASIAAAATALYLWTLLDQGSVQAWMDPDRYYHLMLAAKQAAQGGWALSVLPAVEGLGWQDFFPDKEPLFHLLTDYA